MIEIKYDIFHDGVFFTLLSDDNIIPHDMWDVYDDAIVYQSVLQDLIDNGSAVIKNGGVLVEFNAIYQLTPSERRVLTLPVQYPNNICISGTSLLKDTNFQYKVSYRTKEGDRLAVKRNGPFINYEGQKALLSSEQYKLIEAIDEFNSINVASKSFNSNLLAFDRIKGLSEQSKAVLDRYLKNENVFVPSKLKIEIEQNANDDYSVVPTIDHPLAIQFDRYLDKYEDAPDGIALSYDNNERVRVVFDDEQKKVISKVKKHYKHVSKKQLETLVEEPGMILDPDVCDISVFYSDRVIEIGLYKPKFYSFISPYKSSWIPSFQIEDRVNGSSVISFETDEELEKFAECIHKAELEGKESVEYNDISLNIEDAKQIYEQSKKKLTQYKKDKKAKEILIIEGNEEKLGYSEKGIDFEKNNKKYTFHSIPGLKSSVQLKEHQVDGIAWMQYLIEKNQKGCLLADDMGLGKTLQILSTINWYENTCNKEGNPYLIVAPVSLLENWEAEYKNFFEKTARIKFVVIHGSNQLHGYEQKKIDRNLINALQNRQIILTNYETLRSYQFSFCAVNYSIIVLDEAQKIKTPGTMVTSATKALKGNFKVAMTGTPVENTLVDLWCIMDFAMPGLLGNCKEFNRKYQSVFMAEDSDILASGKEIRNNLGCFFLRRLKTNALKCLPNKDIERVTMQMPEIQLESYKNIIAEAQREKCKPIPTPGYMLVCLQKLREVSDHPYLTEMDTNSYSVEELINSSAKMKAIIPILNGIKDKKEKVIIFAERRETQKMLKRIVRFEFGIESHIVNGETPSFQSRYVTSGKLSRQQAIDDFQSRNGFNVIIMSPIAAGMGLNVTGANHVIHYSRHWNPAKEEQATDRVYRIGQEKDVHVYYPMAVSDEMNTFDITLDNLLKKKSELASATLFPTGRIEVNSEELFNSLIQ